MLQNKNVSFEDTPKSIKVKKHISSKPIFPAQNSATLDQNEEIKNEEFIKQRLSKIIPGFKEEMFHKYISPVRNSKTNINDSIQIDQNELEVQRQMLINEHNSNPSQINQSEEIKSEHNSNIVEEKDPNINLKNQKWFQNKIGNKHYEVVTTLPQIERNPTRDEYHASLENDIKDLKRQLAELSKQQVSKIPQELPIIESSKPIQESRMKRNLRQLPSINQNKIVHPHHHKSAQRIIQKLPSEMTEDSNDIFIKSMKSNTPKKRNRSIIRSNESSYVIEVPKLGEITLKAGDHRPQNNIYDPFEIHEKLKRNMILYLDIDPELNAELRTIKPVLMKDNKGLNNANEHIPIPISTKKNLVSEAADFVKYYEQVQNAEYPQRKEIDDSLDDFIVYLKGLKNKFLEDLILNKIETINDDIKKTHLFQNYPSREILDESIDSQHVSKHQDIQDIQFEQMKEYEKEIDRVITEEEKSFTAKNESGYNKNPYQTMKESNDNLSVSVYDSSDYRNKTLTSIQLQSNKQKQSTFRSENSKQQQNSEEQKELPETSKYENSAKDLSRIIEPSKSKRNIEPMMKSMVKPEIFPDLTTLNSPETPTYPAETIVSSQNIPQNPPESLKSKPTMTSKASIKLNRSEVQREEKQPQPSKSEKILPDLNNDANPKLNSSKQSNDGGSKSFTAPKGKQQSFHDTKVDESVISSKSNMRPPKPPNSLNQSGVSSKTTPLPAQPKQITQKSVTSKEAHKSAAKEESKLLGQIFNEENKASIIKQKSIDNNSGSTPQNSTPNRKNGNPFLMNRGKKNAAAAQPETKPNKVSMNDQFVIKEENESVEESKREPPKSLFKK